MAKSFAQRRDALIGAHCATSTGACHITVRVRKLMFTQVCADALESMPKQLRCTGGITT